MLKELFSLWNKEYDMGKIRLDEYPFERKVTTPNGNIWFFSTRSSEGRFYATPPETSCCWLGQVEPIAGFLGESKVSFNTYPYKRGSLLIISPEHRIAPIEQDLRDWIQIQTTLEKEADPLRPYLLWNMKGSGASLDHIHSHIVFIDPEPLWVEKAPRTPIADNIFRIEYLLFGFAISHDASLTYRVLSSLLDAGFECNVSISHNEIRVFPRRTLYSSVTSKPFFERVTDPKTYTDKVAASEVNGLYSTTHPDITELLRTADDTILLQLFERTLRDISLTEKQQTETLALIAKL